MTLERSGRVAPVTPFRSLLKYYICHTLTLAFVLVIIPYAIFYYSSMLSMFNRLLGVFFMLISEKNKRLEYNQMGPRKDGAGVEKREKDLKSSMEREQEKSRTTETTRVRVRLFDENE